MESLTLQNALQEKNIIQLEMQLNQVESASNHPDNSSNPDEELEHLEDNDNDTCPSPVVDNSNWNCNRRQGRVIKQAKTNLSYEAAEAFDKVLTEKSGLGFHSSGCFHENKSAGKQLDEFDPLLLANLKL